MLDQKDEITVTTIYNLAFLVVFTMWACVLSSARLVHDQTLNAIVTDHEYTIQLLLRERNKGLCLHQGSPVPCSLVKSLHTV